MCEKKQLKIPCLSSFNRCFHVSAGSAMYEHAMRLGQEVSGLDSLQKQVEVSLKFNLKTVLFDESFEFLVIFSLLFLDSVFRPNVI